MEGAEESMIKKLLKFYKKCYPICTTSYFNDIHNPLPQQDELLEGLNHLYKDVNIGKVTQ